MLSCACWGSDRESMSLFRWLKWVAHLNGSGVEWVSRFCRKKQYSAHIHHIPMGSKCRGNATRVSQ